MAGSLIAAEALEQRDLEGWGASVGRGATHGGAALPLVMALRGPLGAGKSVLARAVARGAGVAGPMPSPTYNLVFRYIGSTGVEIHHLDLYRLEHPDDVWELGWRELGEGEQIVLIEWPDRAESLLPPDRWDAWLDFADEAGASRSTGRGASVADPGLRRLRLERRGSAPALPAPREVP